MLKLDLPNNCTVQLIYLGDKKVLNVIKNGTSMYDYIPSGIKITKAGGGLILVSDNKVLLNTFYRKVLTFVKYINKGTKKHLFLKGLGLKVNGFRTTSELSTLKFKLGYSHEIPISYSSLNHNTLLRKTHIFIEGSNPVLVGNFAKQLSMLRKPDAYKGRGVWLHGRRYKLKVVKKKK